MGSLREEIEWFPESTPPDEKTASDWILLAGKGWTAQGQFIVATKTFYVHDARNPARITHWARLPKGPV